MNKRLHELDSLRGLAALSVVASHFAATLPNLPQWFSFIDNSPLHLFYSGHQAVIFFFVLSGFVLSLPFFNNNSTTPYRLYITKRILRIYPPYIFAAGSAIILRQLLYTGDVPGLTPWFNSSWMNPVTWTVIRNHILMIVPFNDCDFDPVLWSLVQEMRISIIFPAIIYLVRCREKAGIVVGVLTSAFCFLMMTLKDTGIISFTFPLLKTINFITPFIIGAILAKHRESLVYFVSRIPRNSKVLLTIGATFLYTYPFWFPNLVSFVNKPLSDLLGQSVIGELATTAGVSIFIIASLSARKLSGLLALRPIRYIGAISYSLYLYHAICLKSIVTLWHTSLPLWELLLVSFIVSLMVATLSYRWVEIPCINIGKRLTRRYYAANLQRQPEGLSAVP